jgi:Zn-dependent protease with chaperone function
MNAWMVLLFVGVFAVEARRRFHRLYLQTLHLRPEAFILQRGLQQTTQYLMILSLIFFALEIYLLNFKSLVALVPGTGRFSALEGLIGISLYVVHLVLIWVLGYPAQQAILPSTQARGPYLRSQLQFNLPIFFPWLAITLLSDLLDLISLPALRTFLDQPVGEIIYVLLFLAVLAVFFPFLIKTWWQCRPLPEGPKQNLLKAFSRRLGSPFRGMYLWPAFGGRMLTAGVMGLVKRFRYLLITPGLLELLEPDELAGVVAHEIGHVRKKHLVFYLLFFAGYVLLAVFFSQWLTLSLLRRPEVLNLFSAFKDYSEDLFSAFLIVPMALGLVLYFRFLFGFFMRNFERQADLFALEVLGTPGPLIRSLEKIGWASGQNRDLPNWHHFSIAQRVEFLEKVHARPALGRRHHRKIYWSVGLFIFLLIGLGLYGLKERIWFSAGSGQDLPALESLLTGQLQSRPEDTKILTALAMVYQEGKKFDQAKEVYEKILKLEPKNYWALNNLAWLLATAKDPKLFQPQRSLDLAREAASLKPDPVILDTLAEAYLVNGRPDLALKTIQEVLAKNPPQRQYYLSQEERFKKARPGRPTRTFSSGWSGKTTGGSSSGAKAHQTGAVGYVTGPSPCTGPDHPRPSGL